MDQIEGVISYIENEINKNYMTEIETRMIGEMIMDKLKDIDEVSYVRFASVYKEFKDFHDEIKLDKFFLEKSKYEKRDVHIFESIISLAKKLDMKVTQEGVETIEDARKLKDLGCDVIQGYYYSYPLSMSDYISFVSSLNEHNIKFD